MSSDSSSPSTSSRERLTKAQVRHRLERESVYLNARQLEELIRVGLIPELDQDGTWPSDVMRHARRAHSLSESARALDRRVILRATEPDHAIQPEKLKSSLAAVLARLERPASKLRRVYAASEAYGHWAIPPSDEPPVRPEDVHPRLPVHKWQTLILNTDAGLMPPALEIAALHDNLVTAQERAMPASARLNLDKIPVEERLALLVLIRIRAAKDRQRPRTGDDAFA